MSRVREVHGNYYLTKDLPNGSCKNIEKFGKTPPIKYIPYIIEGDAREKIYEIPKETIALIVYKKLSRFFSFF